MKRMIKFNRKNIISCTNIPMTAIMWNYICWILAGKPDGYKYEWKRR